MVRPVNSVNCILKLSRPTKTRANEDKPSKYILPHHHQRHVDARAIEYDIGLYCSQTTRLLFACNAERVIYCYKTVGQTRVCIKPRINSLLTVNTRQPHYTVICISAPHTQLSTHTPQLKYMIRNE